MQQTEQIKVILMSTYTQNICFLWRNIANYPKNYLFCWPAVMGLKYCFTLLSHSVLLYQTIRSLSFSVVDPH